MHLQHIWTTVMNKPLYMIISFKFQTYIQGYQGQTFEPSSVKGLMQRLHFRSQYQFHKPPKSISSYSLISISQSMNEWDLSVYILLV